MTENHENPADAAASETAASETAASDATAATSDGAVVVPSAATPPSVMDLLAEHVPLALLADLAAPDGPVSQAILETEGMPDDPWWEGDDRTPPAADAAAEGDEDELPVDPDAAAG